MFLCRRSERAEDDPVTIVLRKGPLDTYTHLRRVYCFCFLFPLMVVSIPIFFIYIYISLSYQSTLSGLEHHLVFFFALSLSILVWNCVAGEFAMFNTICPFFYISEIRVVN